MYGLPDYARMLAEPVRFSAYRRAIERAVCPGDVVIDLGAGPGIFSLLAAQAGARRVYAVEPDPVVQWVDELASRNGLEDRIEAVPRLSTGWTPEQPADVVISDLRGILPTFYDHLASLRDARIRLLRSGGQLIPARDELWTAAVSAPEALARHLGGFRAVPGLDLEPPRRAASHLYFRAELGAEALASEPRLLGAVEYGASEETSFRGEVVLELRGGPVDGLAVWFDAWLDIVETFSNSPEAAKTIYGQAVFPLPDVFESRPGDRMTLRFSAHRADPDYVYRWAGRVERQGSPKPALVFDQSTFHGAPLAPLDLARRAPDFVPRLGDEARIDAWVLGQLGASSGASLGEVAEGLVSRFPERFADAHQALRHAARVADRYSR
ncbi:MAG: 50S ribosomal protein L11 methyltransferase [Acidobacteriota bacterium]